MRAIWPDNISLEVLIPMIWCLVITFWEMLAVAPWIRSEVKQSWPYPKPIHVAGGRPFPLGRRTAVQRVCCECSSFQCELDAPTGAEWEGYPMSHTSDLWIFKNGIRYISKWYNIAILWLWRRVLQISWDWFGTFQLHYTPEI